MIAFASAGGELREVSATATVASDAVVRFFAALARLASGVEEATRWVDSASPGLQPLQRRFGEVPIDIYQEFDGSWTIFIGSQVTTGPPEGWVGLEVRP